MTGMTALSDTADFRGLVLVVEDDADIAELVDELLTSEGYAVERLRDRRIGSVQAAIARLRRFLSVPRRPTPCRPCPSVSLTIPGPGRC